MSLAVNVDGLTSHGNSPETTQPSDIGNGVQPLISGPSKPGEISAAAINLPYQLLAISAFVVLAVLISLTMRRKKLLVSNYLSRRRSLSIVALGIAAFLLYIEAFGLKRLYNYLALTVPGRNQPISEANIISIITTAALGATVLGALLGSFLSLRRRNLEKSTILLANSKTREKVEEFKDVIDRARTLLNLGSDYRATIIMCYKSLCDLLEENGMPVGVTLTPREFEHRVITKLGIPYNHLHEVTLLFEKARYSKENVLSSEASKAKDCLEKLSSQLDDLRFSGQRLIVETEFGENLGQLANNSFDSSSSSSSR
jgi:hypothetical protein